MYNCVYVCMCMGVCACVCARAHVCVGVLCVYAHVCVCVCVVFRGYVHASLIYDYYYSIGNVISMLPSALYS